MKQLFTIALLISCLSLSAQIKTISILGDSNTWIGGDECNKPRGWNTWFARSMPETKCYSYARSGATWTHTPLTEHNTSENIGVLGNNNVISNQVYRLIDAVNAGKQSSPDLIIIMAGTNDVWFNDKRPHALDTVYSDSTRWMTLASAVKCNVELLRECFPTVSIALLTPMQTTAAELQKITLAGDIIERQGCEMGCNVLRMDRESCVKSELERQRKHYTTDGTHTNAEGARRNGRLVAKWINGLKSQYTETQQ